MKRYPILEVCARIEGHTVQQQMLREYCRNFDDWRGLMERAEREGMAPLLRKHLQESEADIPASVRRSLNLLHKRHQKQAKVRLQVLENLFKLFQQYHLTPMPIKGAALCQTLYPDPALRPMRDMDILFSKDEVDLAQELLRNVGFEQSTSPIPPDHYHLPSLYTTVDDVNICIELHRDLYPNTPPYYPEIVFKYLWKTGNTINVGETEVFVFSREETLHYLYQHGFRAPLTYETFKLINASDLIGFTEKYCMEINWLLVKERFPQLYRALPLMRQISPWNADRISESFISRRKRQRKLQPVPFIGWPQRRVKELEGKASLSKVVKETFLPSSWWLRVYYGAGDSGWRYLKAICFDHPKIIFWWMHVYSHIATQADQASINRKSNLLGSLRLFFVSIYRKIHGILRKLSTLKNSRKEEVGH